MTTVLEQVPVWTDNYAWVASRGADAFVVDPPEAEPVLEVLKARGLTLRAVLQTHHHPDHVGGTVDLVNATGCRVYGAAHDQERLPVVTDAVALDDTVVVCGFSFRVLDVRAHTRGHIAWIGTEPFDEVWRHGHGGARARVAALEGRAALFVGDALFAAGCGRLFEGTGTDLEAALRRLAGCDPQALVVCAHEYTASNLRFALSAYPNHPGIAARAAGLDVEKGATGASVPSTLALELATNPFLLALHDVDPVAAVTALRRAKDNA